MRGLKGTNTDVSDIIRGFNTYFKNSVGDGSWGDTNAHDQHIIDLTKKVNNLSNKGTNAVGSTPDTTTPNKDCHARPAWRINKKCKTSKYPDSGALMAWCTHHKPKNCVLNCMYIQKGNNHEYWVEKRTKFQADWNAKKRERKGAAVVSTVNIPTRIAISSPKIMDNLESLPVSSAIKQYFLLAHDVRLPKRLL